MTTEQFETLEIPPSSRIKKMEYCKRSALLRVTFNNDGVYIYKWVGPSTIDLLKKDIAIHGVGKAFQLNIINRGYGYEKLAK